MLYLVGITDSVTVGEKLFCAAISMNSNEKFLFKVSNGYLASSAAYNKKEIQNF